GLTRRSWRLGFPSLDTWFEQCPHRYFPRLLNRNGAYILGLPTRLTHISCVWGLTAGHGRATLSWSSREALGHLWRACSGASSVPPWAPGIPLTAGRTSHRGRSHRWPKPQPTPHPTARRAGGTKPAP